MKKVLALVAAPLALSLLPLAASAQQAVVDGTVRGYVATVTNASPALDKQDPALKAERSFVVATDGDYLFVPNVSRETLRKYATDRVRVVGELAPERHSIVASEIELRSGDHWRQVWSKREEQRRRWDEERRYLMD